MISCRFLREYQLIETITTSDPMTTEDRDYERKHPREDYTPGDVWLICVDCGVRFPVPVDEAKHLAPSTTLCDDCLRKDQQR